MSLGEKKKLKPALKAEGMPSRKLIQLDSSIVGERFCKTVYDEH